MELLIGGTLLGTAAVLWRSYRPTIGDGVQVVKDFNFENYLGKWYEVARLDYPKEKDLNNVTSEYSRNNDGSMKIVNVGFNPYTNKFETVEGKAVFIDKQNEGLMKVSFFGPFYSGYNIISVDQDYKYALVAGRNLDYLWILSRTPTIPDTIKEKYCALANSFGYDTSKLIWVEHNINCINNNNQQSTLPNE